MGGEVVKHVEALGCELVFDGKSMIDENWLRSYGFADRFVEGDKCLAFGVVALRQTGKAWRVHIGGWWEWLPRPTRENVLTLLTMFEE
jgi:hypothetical protein